MVTMKIFFFFLLNENSFYNYTAGCKFSDEGIKILYHSSFYPVVWTRLSLRHSIYIR